MRNLIFIFRYLKYLFKSGNEHSIHSPFVYNLYSQALKPRKQYYTFKEIELLRRALINDKREISYKDYGAGHFKKGNTVRKVSDIARNFSKKPEIAQVLFRLSCYLAPTYILELGTSLGITTSYFAKSQKKCKVISLEGCDESLDVARENFRKLKLGNITTIKGNIDITLEETIKNIPRIDLAFFDANHRYEPTINYFNTCLLKAHEESVFIFDDIYWSAEMVKAWNEIKSHPAVTVSIDLFYFGIVFFRKAQPKEHFNLRV